MLKSECQQLICEILRATPEAASADAAVQTARLASKVPSKEKRYVKLLSTDPFRTPRLSCSLCLFINYHIWGA